MTGATPGTPDRTTLARAPAPRPRPDRAEMQTGIVASRRRYVMTTN
jgi:hypothetical protein